MKKINIEKDWLFNQYITLNKTVGDISTEFELPIRSVGRRIQEYGFKKSNKAKNETISQKRTKIHLNKDDLYNLYIIENKSIDEIAKLYCTSKMTIYDKLCEYNIEKSEMKIKQSIINSNLRKFGTTTPSQNEKIKQKIVETNLKKYGVKCTLQDKNTKEKIKNTMITKYGVPSPLQNKNIKEKRERTCIEKYGTKNPLKNKDIQKKAVRTNLKKYGAEHHMQSKSSDEIKKILNKSRITMKNKNTFIHSKSEDEYYNYLIREIDQNTQRQVIKNGFCIDFYLPGYDIYIQFDGSYWHGYLNTAEELLKTTQGRRIMKTIENDKKQNDAIPNLIRIREDEWN